MFSPLLGPVCLPSLGFLFSFLVDTLMNNGSPLYHALALHLA